MKNFFRPVTVEKYKYVTLVWIPQVESVAKMCQEHYDTKEYDDTVIFIDCYYDNDGQQLNPYWFQQKKKIYYNLEHKYCFGLDVNADNVLLNWLNFMNINEIWTIEPDISFFESKFKTEYMPMRYTVNFNKLSKHSDKLIDLGFVGVIGGGASEHRDKFLKDYTYNLNMDFSIKIINGFSIQNLQDDLSNCKFMLDMKREWVQEYQNQVRLFEHICLGHTVLSEKCQNNIFPGLIYEWSDSNELLSLIHTAKCEDFSEKYKEMTYRDNDYEDYRNNMIATY